MERENQEYISIVNATENNLKHVSLKIPKKKITVFTGVSGSGKSSLCLDTIAAESRRELNVTFPSFVQQFLPKYGRPEVERMENLPVTIVIDQKKPVANSRSTVGTYTDIYALLRLLFSRVGKPFVGYSDSFSFNHPSGKCERCEGLGVVTELDIHKLVDFDKCLNDEGVIQWPAFTTGAWRWKRYAYSGLFDLDKKIKDYSKEEMDLFLYSPQIRLKNPPANWPKSAKYEGIYPRMYRSIITSKEGQLHKKELDRIVSTFTCPECHGARLNAKIRSCLINGKNICEVSDMPIPEAAEFIRQIDDPLARDIKTEILKRMNALIEIGLSYLSLSRGTDTLSGGEAQRIKIARYINSPLTDMMYVLDEPSVGLHSRDIQNLKNSLIKLKEHGNTVMIVEHHREVIALADHIVDMGPEAGINGGQIMYQGSYENLLKADTVTGRMLRTKTPMKMEYRKPTGWYQVEHAKLHNLKDLSVKLPLGVMTVIAGVAGSGKSSLMEYFMSQYPGGNFLFFLGCGIPNAKPVRDPPGGTIIIRINRRAFQLGDPLGVFRQEAVDLQHFRRGFPQHQMETEVQLFYIQRLCVPLVQQLEESLQNNWGDLLRYTVGTGIRHDIAAHPFTLDQLGPQWGSRGILQMRQGLLSSRFVLALFCIHKLEQQFGVCFILAQLQNGLFSLYALGGQLFQSHHSFFSYPTMVVSLTARLS